MSNIVKLYENFSIKDSINSIKGKVKDQLTNMILDSANGMSKMSLLTEAAVTHAGIVNANLGFYKPEKLQASIDSWTKPFRKPVLVDHDMHLDPIGRVEGSLYKSTVPGLAPKIKNSVYSTDFSYRGLGHIQNLLGIYDAAAVDKVLDGRYLTLSVHGSNDAMNCSICNQEWVNDGRCFHKFGDTYQNERTGEEELAYWIAGNFSWDEVSFVNEPADPFAQVLNREVSGDAKDQILKTYSYKEATNLERPVTDSVNRYLKFYAFSDSKSAPVELNEKTELSSLEKLYDFRLHAVGVDFNTKPKETITVADNNGNPATATAETAVVATATSEATATVADSKTTTTVADPAATTAVTATPAVQTAAVADVKATPTTATVVVEDAAKVLEDKIKAAVTDATKPLEDKITEHVASIKTLEDAAKVLTDEKTTLTQTATNLQAKIRDMRMEQIMDLKETLGLETYSSIEDRTKVKEGMVARSIESIEDQVKDLTDSLKKTKRPGLANVNVGDSGAITDKTAVEVLTDSLSQMSAEQLIAAKFSGRGIFNAAVKK